MYAEVERFAVTCPYIVALNIVNDAPTLGRAAREVAAQDPRAALLRDMAIIGAGFQIRVVAFAETCRAFYRLFFPPHLRHRGMGFPHDSMVLVCASRGSCFIRLSSRSAAERDRAQAAWFFGPGNSEIGTARRGLFCSWNDRQDWHE